MSLSLSRNAPRVDHRAMNARQLSAWADGDYAVVGNALQLVSEELCETVNLCQDQRVLDVAAGGYYSAMAAARRWCDVTATAMPSDLARAGRRRLESEAVGVRFVDGDAEALPFGDQSFDAVLSTFGAMFALDPERAASELVRVCRRGQLIGLANWTPDGFIGQLLKTLDGAAPGSRGEPACAWGTAERLFDLFGAYGNVHCAVKAVIFRARTPMDWVDRLRASHAPASRVFAMLDAEGRRALRGRLLDLVGQFNRARDTTMMVEAEYLEVVVRRR